jgi:hypothetical protein
MILRKDPLIYENSSDEKRLTKSVTFFIGLLLVFLTVLGIFFFSLASGSFAMNITSFKETALTPGLPYTYEGVTYDGLFAFYRYNETYNFYYYQTERLNGNVNLHASTPYDYFISTFTAPYNVLLWSYDTDMQNGVHSHVNGWNSAFFNDAVMNSDYVLSSADIYAYDSATFIRHSLGSFDAGNIIMSANFTGVPDDTIDYPSSNSYVVAGVIDFGGKCSDVGINYVLTWQDWRLPDESSLDIECLSDHTWTGMFDVSMTGGGGHEYFLYNNIKNTFTSVVLIGFDPTTYDWGLSLQYPNLDENRSALIPVVEYAYNLRFFYKIPVNFDPTTVYFNMDEFPDATYTDNAGTAIVIPTSVAELALEPEKDFGILEIQPDISEGKHYYQASLVENNTSTQVFNMRFMLEGTTNPDAVGVQAAAGGTIQDTGSILGNTLRDLFIPSGDFFTLIYMDYSDLLRSYFGGYYAFIDKINDIQLNEFDASALSFNIVYGGFSQPVIFAIPENIPPIVPDLMSKIIYISTGIFLIKRFPDLFPE